MGGIHIRAHKCTHPRDQVISEYSGGMHFSPDGPWDDYREVFYCNACKQEVEEKDLPWLYEPDVDFVVEEIPF